jgi:sulfite exporter TauE/SafE
VLDLFLIASIGFLGSFGHCAGMCSPLAISFSLSQQDRVKSSWLRSLVFHLLLNLGRIISYALVGAALGSISSLIFTGTVRQLMAIIMGLLLIWLGLLRIKPDFLPSLPILHPLPGKLHDRLSKAMFTLASHTAWWTPVMLGICWGLIPCGFLYAAQIKAAESNNLLWGMAVMLAFGLGTMPTMVAVGLSASRLSSDRKSQLSRLGGWITLLIGFLTLWRTDTMIDYTGHGALLLLMLALIARPIAKFWSAPLQYRRAIGVGAYLLAIAHTAHMFDHSFNWNFASIPFMLPQHQLGLVIGTISFCLMTPAALTSLDRWQNILGRRWRQLHLLCIPALFLASGHTILIGSHYLGELTWNWQAGLRVVGIVGLTGGVMLLRLFHPWQKAKN